MAQSKQKTRRNCIMLRREPRTRLAVRGVPKGALRTHSDSQVPVWGGIVTCRVLFARSPVLGLCFNVSVKRVEGAQVDGLLGRRGRLGHGSDFPLVPLWTGRRNQGVENTN